MPPHAGGLMSPFLRSDESLHRVSVEQGVPLYRNCGRRFSAESFDMSYTHCLINPLQSSSGRGKDDSFSVSERKPEHEEMKGYQKENFYPALLN